MDKGVLVMKNVLIFVECLSGGGAEKVLLTLAKSINKEKYDITVFCLIETGIYVEEMKKYCKVKYALKDYSQYRFLGKIYYRLKNWAIYHLNINLIYKCLIKDDYDIEIAFVEGFDTKIIAASNSKKSKKIAWVHSDMINNNHADIHFNNIEEQRNAYLQYDNIIAVSHDVKESFMKKFNIYNVTVQYNPIDTIDIIQKSKEVLYPYDVKDCLKVIAVGRLEEQKGFDRLLRIMNKLKQNGYKFNLTVLGEGRLRKYLEGYIIENQLESYIELRGFISNPYPYLKNADLYVCSSYTEGFSTVATEALILGLPIVTTDCSGMRELFGTFECGIITNNNEDDLFLGLRKIFDDVSLLQHYKSQIAKRNKSFDLKRRISEIEGIFDETSVNCM